MYSINELNNKELEKYLAIIIFSDIIYKTVK